MPAPDFLFDGPARAPLTVVLAHGAGAPMDSPWMERVASEIAGHDLRVARFEFPYMNERRTSGKKKPPNRLPVLEATWHEIIDALGADRLVIGGKSMGGRVASMIADTAGVRGLVCLGYPFHPPGSPERTRIAHLETLATPALICQGERDPFGRRDEVETYRLSPRIRFHWLADGDHGFKPRKASGHTEHEHIADAAAALATFAETLRQKAG